MEETLARLIADSDKQKGSSDREINSPAKYGGSFN
jgi:hypothetical protein